MAGDDVGLPGQVGNPEAVDHVDRRELDARRLADREVQLVGGFNPLRGPRLAVGDAPPPLLPGDPHLQPFASRRLREASVDQEAARGEHEQAGDDQGGPDAQRKLQSRLQDVRIRLQPAARPPDRPAQEPQHQEVHRPADPKHQLQQPEQMARLIGGRRQRRLRPLAGAQRQNAEAHQGGASKPHRSAPVQAAA